LRSGALRNGPTKSLTASCTAHGQLARTANLRLQIAPAVKVVPRDHVILPLADAFIRAKNRVRKGGAVQASRRETREFTSTSMAGRGMAGRVRQATGIMRKLSKFALRPRRLPTKTYSRRLIPRPIRNRNAATMESDADISAPWQIREQGNRISVSLCGVSFIEATIGLSDGESG